MSFGLQLATSVSAQQFVILEPDPAHDCPGTSPTSINERGEVTGLCLGQLIHGFVRNSDGNTTVFDAPSACGFTEPRGVNNRGEIAGNFQDASGTKRGFLRSPSGDFTIIDAPSGPSDPMGVNSINDAGETTGVFFDSRVGRARSYVRDTQGQIVVFDAPTTGNLENTIGLFINSAGEVAGTFTLTNNRFRPSGFLRDRQGFVTTFDAPNNGNLLSVSGINGHGEITGILIDGTSGQRRGFIRGRDGDFTLFDAPGDFVGVSGINDRGEVIGSFAAGFVDEGYVRDRQGAITTFSPTGSETLVSAINNRGEVVGAFLDAAEVLHGFIAHF